jgi:hypothetical protein
VEASQSHRLLAVMDTVTEILQEALEDASALNNCHGELVGLRPWLATARSAARRSTGLGDPRPCRDL